MLVPYYTASTLLYGYKIIVSSLYLGHYAIIHNRIIGY